MLFLLLFVVICCYLFVFLIIDLWIMNKHQSHASLTSHVLIYFYIVIHQLLPPAGFNELHCPPLYVISPPMDV